MFPLVFLNRPPHEHLDLLVDGAANAGGKDILCVGFDNSSSNRAHVRDGEMLAFMAQNPNIMGEKSIEAAVALMQGESLAETQVDTGVSVVTKDNVDQFED